MQCSSVGWSLAQWWKDIRPWRPKFGPEGKFWGVNKKQRSCNGQGGAKRPVWRGNEPKKTGARSARARTRGQNPLVYIYPATTSKIRFTMNQKMYTGESVVKLFNPVLHLLNYNSFPPRLPYRAEGLRKKNGKKRLPYVNYRFLKRQSNEYGNVDKSSPVIARKSVLGCLNR
jgi:hypothetical protein